MGHAHKAPAREYTRRHIITSHALLRFREYGGTLANSATDADVWNMLDEAITAGLPDAEKYLDQENSETWIMRFDSRMWVDYPVYFVLGEDLINRTGKWVLKTVLTEVAFESNLAKAKLIPWTTAQETALIEQEEASRMKAEADRKLSLAQLPPYDMLRSPTPPAPVEPVAVVEDMLLMEVVDGGFRILGLVSEGQYQRAVLQAILDGVHPDKLVLFKKHGEVSLNISLK